MTAPSTPLLMPVLFSLAKAPQRKRSISKNVLLASLSLLLVSGCAIKPQPYDKQEIAQITELDRQNHLSDMSPIEGKLTLEEAIARALKYNLEHRTRRLEQSLATEYLAASRFDMLPTLLANAGYSSRDKDNIRLSSNSFGGDSGTSTERDHMTQDLTLSWNVLDFGVSYYNAKQNADRLLIADERRRKAMHNLIQNVRSTYWRAIAAEKLDTELKSTIAEAEAALQDSRNILKERINAPVDALRYQRNVLENLRLLANVQRELASARIELAGLIGVIPGPRLQLVEPAEPTSLQIPITLERMEEVALLNNPDLKEQLYNVRIAANETRNALLRLLPGISLNYGVYHDDDKFLVNQVWQEAGVRVGFNLFNLISGPSQLRTARAGVDVAESRRMALQMAVLTQVHLSHYQYERSVEELRRADDIHQVESLLAALVQREEQSGMVSRLDRVATSVSSIISSLRRYQAMSAVNEAESILQASLGFQPRIDNVDEVSLGELTRLVEESLGKWSGFMGEEI